MATTNDRRDRPMAEPGKPQAGADPGARPSPAPTSSGAPAAQPADDDEDPWRHPPVAPRDEDPLKSLGRAISEPVTGASRDDRAKPKG